MFIVFNKQKIYSYLVALATVLTLFLFAFIATNKPQDTVQTSTNMDVNTQIENISNGDNQANVKLNNM